MTATILTPNCPLSVLSLSVALSVSERVQPRPRIFPSFSLSSKVQVERGRGGTSYRNYASLNYELRRLRDLFLKGVFALFRATRGIYP